VALGAEDFADIYAFLKSRRDSHGRGSFQP